MFFGLQQKLLATFLLYDNFTPVNHLISLPTPTLLNASCLLTPRSGRDRRTLPLAPAGLDASR